MLRLPLKFVNARQNFCLQFKNFHRSRSTSFSSQPIASAYNYAEVEKGLYERWEKDGHFKEQPSKPDKPAAFHMILPPPNVTGTLHLGHALTGSIQDALARWHRMNGKAVLWIPGLDHAGIATQAVVEKHLAASGLGDRNSLGREKFIEEVWKWKESKGDFILKQLQNLGCSLDWSRQYFTLDQTRSEAVVEAFIRLFESGLIYRAESLVNWSCQLQSAIADIEVDWLQLEKPTFISVPGYKEKVKFGEMTHVALPVSGESGELVVATTRLETMVGDSAVAVHPQDQRYSSFIGKLVDHPLRPGAKIPVVADDFVDPEFGTGVVKITPAHDATDFDVGKRHSLDVVPVFSNDGLILPAGGHFAGMKRFQAREEIRKHLSSLGLLRGVSDVPNSKIPICSRSGDVIELMLRPQWFMNCKNMARDAVKSVETGELVIEPQAFHKIWNHWLNDVKDWCISRQLWWGHQIPAYLCKCTDSNKEVWVAAENKKVATQKAEKILNSSELVVTQDVDVLDTWFSSALLPFAAFGWPKESFDLQQHYPLTLMETGHDILFFWVARMVMLGKELTGRLPFNKILLHGLICDSHGRKMSKSLGNVISPEDIVHGVSLEELISRLTSANKGSKSELKKAINIQKSSFPKGIPACGTDALRFTLCSHNPKVHVLNFDINECITNKNFCNKMWQATKYVLNSVTEAEVPLAPPELLNLQLSVMDKWILSRLSETVTLVDAAFANENLHEAADAIKDFVYYNFCDIYIEASKPLLQNPATSSSTKSVLLVCEHTFLHLLAPIMPYLSEQLYQHLLRQPQYNSIHKNQFPSPADWALLKNPEVENVASDLIKAAEHIRKLKLACKLTKAETRAIVETEDVELFEQNQNILKWLGVCSEISICQKISEISKTVKSAVNHSTTVYVVGEVKGDAIEKKLAKLRKEEEAIAKTLATTGFIEKAPAEVQEAKKKKLEDIRLQISKYS